jgi:hypothetical protein
MSATLTTLWATIGVLLGLAGLGVVLWLRFGRRGPGHLRLAGVGEISRVTCVVIGLSLLGAGYHVFTHALGLMKHFRAPLGIGVGVAIVAILGSIAIDVLENRLADKHANREE